MKMLLQYANGATRLVEIPDAVLMDLAVSIADREDAAAAAAAKRTPTAITATA